MQNERHFITIHKPGYNPSEIRVLLNRLNFWNRQQIDNYLKNPFEFEVILDSLDYKMVITGLNFYSPNSVYTILNLQEKRNQKINLLER